MIIAYVGYTKSGNTFLTSSILPNIPGVRIVDGRWSPSNDGNVQVNKIDEHARFLAINLNIRYDDDRYFQTELIRQTLADLDEPDYQTVIPLGGISPGWFDVTPKRISSVIGEKGRILISIRRQSDLLKSRYQHDCQAAARWMYYRNGQRLVVPSFEQAISEDLPLCRYPLCARSIAVSSAPRSEAKICGSFYWFNGYRPISLPIYELDRLYESYSHLVGKENVHVFVLEAWKQSPLQELQRLLDFLNIELDKAEMDLLDSHPPANVQKKENVIDLSASQVGFLKDRYRESNVRLSDLVSLDFENLGYW